VSDAGALTPEAGYFSQMLDITAILVFITGYTRFKQIKYYLIGIGNTKQLPTDELNKLCKTNFRALLYMCVFGIGLVVVGNFRTTEIVLNHFIGMAILIGILLHVSLMVRCFRNYNY